MSFDQIDLRQEQHPHLDVGIPRTKGAGTYSADDLMDMSRRHHARVHQGIEPLDYELGALKAYQSIAPGSQGHNKQCHEALHLVL